MLARPPTFHMPIFFFIVSSKSQRALMMSSNFWIVLLSNILRLTRTSLYIYWHNFGMKYMRRTTNIIIGRFCFSISSMNHLVHVTVSLDVFVVVESNSLLLRPCRVHLYALGRRCLFLFSEVYISPFYRRTIKALTALKYRVEPICWTAAFRYRIG